LLILSPLVLLTLYSIIKSRFNDSIVVFSGSNGEQRNEQVDRLKNENVYVLLFDEMSYDYLYSNGVVQDKYPNFRKLSMVSDNYHSARSPGTSTMSSIPAFILDRNFENEPLQTKGKNLFKKIDGGANKKIDWKVDNNLFKYVNSIGFKSKLYGVYLPYCDFLVNIVNECRSFSFYNYSAVEDEMSLYHPFITTLLMWPNQMPTGLLKIPAYSLWAKKVHHKMKALIMDAISDDGSVFMFAHMMMPHRPYFFNKKGYYFNWNAFKHEDADSYVKQLEYVDSYLGEFINKLKELGKYDESMIVVMSDHNNNILVAGDARRVPLFIKKPQQKTRRDIYDIVETQRAVRDELRVISSRNMMTTK